MGSSLTGHQIPPPYVSKYVDFTNPGQNTYVRARINRHGDCQVSGHLFGDSNVITSDSEPQMQQGAGDGGFLQICLSCLMAYSRF